MTPLHWLGDLMRELLLQIPLPVARGLFIALPVAVLLWVLTLPHEETTPPEDVTGGRIDLKIGAAIALGLQILIYTLF